MQHDVPRHNVEATRTSSRSVAIMVDHNTRASLHPFLYALTLTALIPSRSFSDAWLVSPPNLLGGGTWQAGVGKSLARTCHHDPDHEFHRYCYTSCTTADKWHRCCTGSSAADTRLRRGNEQISPVITMTSRATSSRATSEAMHSRAAATAVVTTAAAVCLPPPSSARSTMMIAHCVARADQGVTSAGEEESPSAAGVGLWSWQDDFASLLNDAGDPWSAATATTGVSATTTIGSTITTSAPAAAAIGMSSPASTSRAATEDGLTQQQQQQRQQQELGELFSAAGSKDQEEEAAAAAAAVAPAAATTPPPPDGEPREKREAQPPGAARTNTGDENNRLQADAPDAAAATAAAPAVPASTVAATTTDTDASSPQQSPTISTAAAGTTTATTAAAGTVQSQSATRRTDTEEDDDRPVDDSPRRRQSLSHVLADAAELMATRGESDAVAGRRAYALLNAELAATNTTANTAATAAAATTTTPTTTTTATSTTATTAAITASAGAAAAISGGPAHHVLIQPAAEALLSWIRCSTSGNGLVVADDGQVATSDTLERRKLWAEHAPRVLQLVKETGKKPALDAEVSRSRRRYSYGWIGCWVPFCVLVFAFFSTTRAWNVER